MAFTIVTVAEMQFMAGENVDSAGDITANHQFLHDYASAYLSTLVKYDIETNWNSINTIYRKILSEWAARFAAVQLISYNMGSYNTRFEAENIIALHIAKLNAIEELLINPDIQDFLGI